MRSTSFWTLAAVAIIALPVAGQENPAALVVRVQGEVQVHPADAPPTPAVVGQRLVAGDRILPGDGSRAILISRTGATQVVTRAITIAAPAEVEDSGMFERAIRTLARAATADARTGGGRQGMIRPLPGEAVLVAPRNGLTVAEAHPTFQWMGVDGVTGYTLQIRKVDGGRPERLPVGQVTTWALPEAHEPLEEGALYAWTVAPDQGRPSREQRFRILTPEEAQELESSLEQVRDLGLDPEGDGLLLTAIVLRDLELPYQAREALDRLEEAGEMDAELYLLKGEILNRLGHAEEAREAFDRADRMMR